MKKILLGLMVVGALSLTYKSAQVISYTANAPTFIDSQSSDTANPIDAAPFLFVGLVITALFRAQQSGLLYDSIDTTALSTLLGAYCRKEKDILIEKIVMGLNLEDRFNVLDDIKDELPLPKMTVADLVQPGDPVNFDPTPDAFAFSGRMLKVRPWKIDIQIFPLLLEKVWLGKYKKKGSDAYDLPFEEFIMAWVVKKAQNNLRMKSIHRGIYNGAGTTPIDVMDGTLKIIADLITATSISPVVTGPISSSNVHDKLLLVYDDLDDEYKDVETQMLVNSTIFDWEMRKFNPITNSSLVSSDIEGMKTQKRINSFPVPGTNTILKREAGFGTSQRILCTQQENMYYGCDTLSEESSNIIVEKSKRGIAIMVDAKSGVNIGDIDSGALAVNDQA